MNKKQYSQIKKYIYTIRAIGIIIIGISIFYLLDKTAPWWLISIGFLLAGIAFFIASIMLRKYPALSPSFLTKRSCHSKEDNSYDKHDNC